MVVIGSGGEWPEVMQSKVFHTGYGSRLTNIKEALQIVKLSTTGNMLDYEGETYSVRRYSAAWAKAMPPLIYHGACGPRMIEMGAPIADGIMMSDVMPAMFSKRLPVLRQALKSSANQNDFRLSNFVAWHVRDNRQRSYAEARRELIIRGWLERDWLEPFLEPHEVESILQNRWPFLKAWIERHGNIEGVPLRVSNKLVEELSFAGDTGDIDGHLEKLAQFAAAGYTEMALRLHEEPAESMRLIARRVLPALRRLQ
jgi:alkanesulfonate monooxygenase SsuD/methylene tetrahydromethanopterin reductase-like flavin-dependent oxidoreductase (luciferase family)